MIPTTEQLAALLDRVREIEDRLEKAGWDERHGESDENNFRRFAGDLPALGGDAVGSFYLISLLTERRVLQALIAQAKERGE